jgi:hypothetical protein
MFKNYSDIEQMQLEVQWWAEQKMLAVNENDLQYIFECNTAIDSLTQAIMLLKDETES